MSEAAVLEPDLGALQAVIKGPGEWALGALPATPEICDVRRRSEARKAAAS